MQETKILVVDDEKEIADLIEIYLVSDGYKVYKAYNAADGLDILAKEDIKLVLLGHHDAGDGRACHVPEDPGDEQHTHYYFKCQVHRPGQDPGAGHRCRRLCDEALQPAGTDRPGEIPAASVYPAESRQ